MSVALRISLGVNVVLLGLAVVLLSRTRTALPAPATATEAARPITDRMASEDESGRTQPEKARAQPGAGRITRAAAARLEAMGISRDVLASVVIEDYNRRSTLQLAALQKKYAPRLVPERVTREFARRCDAEQTAALKEALGDEGYRAWDKEQKLVELNRARTPGDALAMTPEEAERAYQLQKEFDDKARDLQMAMEDGVGDRADIGTLQAQAQAALDQQLKQLLGDARFAALRGNTDATTDVYRDFGDLNPTPEQAQAVVQADATYRAQQTALQEQLKNKPGDGAQVTAELKALNDARDESLRRIFGAEAYEMQQRQNDPTYQTLQQFAGAWDLKDQEVSSVYASLHAFDDQARRLRAAAEMSQAAGQSVDWPAVNAAIDRARRQAEAGLQTLIGAERVQRLEQNGLLGK